MLLYKVVGMYAPFALPHLYSSFLNLLLASCLAHPRDTFPSAKIMMLFSIWPRSGAPKQGCCSLHSLTCFPQLVSEVSCEGR